MAESWGLHSTKDCVTVASLLVPTEAMVAGHVEEERQEAEIAAE